LIQRLGFAEEGLKSISQDVVMVHSWHFFGIWKPKLSLCMSFSVHLPDWAVKNNLNFRYLACSKYYSTSLNSTGRKL